MKSKRIPLNDRGSVLVVSLLVMGVLIGIAALSLDLGMHVLAIIEIQEASDSAALAAVSVLRDGYDANNLQISTDSMNDAIQAAQDTVQYNTVLNQPITLDPNNVIVGSYDSQNRKFVTPYDPTIGNIAVKVTMTNTVPYWFGRFFGYRTRDLTSSPSVATLQISNPANSSRTDTVAIMIVHEGSGDLQPVDLSQTPTEWRDEVAAVSVGLNDAYKARVADDKAGMVAFSSQYPYDFQTSVVNNGTTTLNVYTLNFKQRMSNSSSPVDFYTDTNPPNLIVSRSIAPGGSDANLSKWMSSSVKRASSNNYTNDLTMFAGASKSIDTGLVSLNDTALPSALSDMITTAGADRPLGGADPGPVLNAARAALDAAGTDKKVLIYISKNVPYSLFTDSISGYQDSDYSTSAINAANDIASSGIVMHTITLEPSGSTTYDYNRRNLTKNGGYALTTTSSSNLPTLMDSLLNTQLGRPTLVEYSRQ